jgi:hypothetical protein
MALVTSHQQPAALVVALDRLGLPKPTSSPRNWTTDGGYVTPAAAAGRLFGGPSGCDPPRSPAADA